MSIDPYQQSTRDDIMTSALVRAVGDLLDDLVERVLRTDERVATAAQGKLLIAADDGMQEAAERVQRLVAVATPAVRVLARGGRFTRVPWVLVASTAVSLTTTVRAGVRELRVLSSLLAHRLEQATGARPDPALVTKLAVELYLGPETKARRHNARPASRTAHTEVAAAWCLRPRHPQGGGEGAGRSGAARLG